MSELTLEGGCSCKGVRFRMLSEPIVVHCCHCRWCQRESGASFALNAMIETTLLESLAGASEMVLTPSESGAGQNVARCPACKVALWSHYPSAGPILAFVRVGTLDNPDAIAPDIHIFTSSKQPWVILPPDAPAFEQYYEREQLWSTQALLRREALLPQIEAYQRARQSQSRGA